MTSQVFRNNSFDDPEYYLNNKHRGSSEILIGESSSICSNLAHGKHEACHSIPCGGGAILVSGASSLNMEFSSELSENW